MVGIADPVLPKRDVNPTPQVNNWQTNHLRNLDDLSTSCYRFLRGYLHGTRIRQYGRTQGNRSGTQATHAFLFDRFEMSVLGSLLHSGLCAFGLLPLPLAGTCSGPDSNSELSSSSESLGFSSAWALARARCARRRAPSGNEAKSEGGVQ